MGVIKGNLFFSDFTDPPVQLATPPPVSWEGFWGLVGDTPTPTLIPLLAVPGALPVEDAFQVQWEGRDYTGVPIREFPLLVLVAFALRVVPIIPPLPMLDLKKWGAMAWTALHYRDREVRVTSEGIWANEEWIPHYTPPDRPPIADYSSRKIALAGYDPLREEWVFTDLSPAPFPGWGFVAPEGGVAFAPRGRMKIAHLFRVV